MQHKFRTWKIIAVKSSAELSRLLSEYRHCLCQGFSIGRYFFLNDSEEVTEAVFGVCVDERQAILDSQVILQVPPARQVETIDFSDRAYSECYQKIEAVLSGRYDFYHTGAVDWSRIHWRKRKTNCGHCQDPAIV